MRHTHLPPNPNEGKRYPTENLRTITLGGGCFWGTQAFVDRIPGVAATQCGYANGRTEHPTYEQVCHHNTGHAEVVRVEYDHTVLPLGKLLDYFWTTINPTSRNRQGGDVGSQYRTGIYYNDPADAPVIQDAIASIQKQYERKVVTECGPLESYYPAEAYHQKYLEKNPGGYCHVDLGRLPGQNEVEGSGHG